MKSPISINFPKAAIATELIEKIATTLPVMCGYSDDLKKLYKKDYTAFVNLALSRKHELEHMEDNLNSDNTQETTDQY
jgi:hypothetical protein